MSSVPGVAYAEQLTWVMTPPLVDRFSPSTLHEFGGGHEVRQGHVAFAVRSLASELPEHSVDQWRAAFGRIDEPGLHPAEQLLTEDLRTFLAWIQAAVTEHGWPCEGVDSQQIIDWTLWSVLVHPDDEFRAHCCGLVADLLTERRADPWHLAYLELSLGRTPSVTLSDPPRNPVAKAPTEVNTSFGVDFALEAPPDLAAFNLALVALQLAVEVAVLVNGGSTILRIDGRRPGIGWSSPDGGLRPGADLNSMLDPYRIATGRQYVDLLVTSGAMPPETWYTVGLSPTGSTDDASEREFVRNRWEHIAQTAQALISNGGELSGEAVAVLWPTVA